MTTFANVWYKSHASEFDRKQKYWMMWNEGFILGIRSQAIAGSSEEIRGSMLFLMIGRNFRGSAGSEIREKSWASNRKNKEYLNLVGISLLPTLML